MKYMIRNLFPGSTGDYTTPAGWEICTVLRQFTVDGKLLLSVLLQETAAAASPEPVPLAAHAELPAPGPSARRKPRGKTGDT